MSQEQLTNLMKQYALPTAAAAVLVAIIAISSFQTPTPIAAAPLSTADAGLQMTDGAVYAIAVGGDGTIYLGGSFTRVRGISGGGVPIDTTTADNAATFPQVGGGTGVATVVSDGSGGWYIGGDFTSVGGTTRNRLAHVNADGTLDATFNPNADGDVRALVLTGGVLYVGGAFVNIGGQARNFLAAIDTTTGIATSWDPNADSTVETLALSGTTLYAGGWFLNIGGQARNRIAAIDTTTGSVASWNPNADSTVYTLALSGTTLYAGGWFLNIGGQARNLLAAIDTTTGSATSWDPNVGGSKVSTLALSGTTLYAGGSFSYIGGQTRKGLAAIDTTDGIATSWNPSADSTVQALAISGTTIYAGGIFTAVGGTKRNYLAAINPSTGAATSWDPNANNDVNTLAISGSTVYVGGNFGSVGGQPRTGLAAVDAATGAVTSWAADADLPVHAMTISGSTVYVGGEFGTIGGQARNRLAAIDTTTGSVASWDPNANGVVRSLALSGTTMYVGGSFVNIGGQARNRLAAIDTTTGIATSWDPNADNTVETLALSSGAAMYVGGSFVNIGGQARNGLAAIDTTTGSATSWNPNADGDVETLALSGTTLYVGGNSVNIGGQARNGLAAIDTTTGSATSWDPNANGTVQKLVFSGSTLYVGGNFTQMGGGAGKSGSFVRFVAASITIEFGGTSSSGSEATTPATLAVTLSASADVDVTVDYTVAGTATGGGVDYTLAAGTLTIPAGQTTANISIPIGDDAVDETSETIVVTLSNPSDATLGATTVHTYTITDNDGTTSVSASITDGQIGVPLNAQLAITFAQAINPSTATTSTITLRPTATPNAATLCTAIGITMSNTRVMCERGALLPNTQYTLTATTGVQSTDGRALEAAHSRTFTTSSFDVEANATAPMVIESSPVAGELWFPANGMTVLLRFSDGPEGDMQVGAGATSVENPTNLTVRAIGPDGARIGPDLCPTDCGMTFTGGSRWLRVALTSAPIDGLEYELELRGVKNGAGVSLATPFIIRFTAGPADFTGPTLRSSSPTSPENGAVGVSRFTPEFLVFYSETVDPTGNRPALYRDLDESGTRNGAETLATTTLSQHDAEAQAHRLQSIDALEANARYCFEIPGGTGIGIRDLVGNTLAATISNQCFTTANDTDTTSPKLLWVDVDNFKILARFSEPMDQSMLTWSLECPVGITVTSRASTFSLFDPETNEFEVNGYGLQTGIDCRITFTDGTDLAGNAIVQNGTDNVANFEVLSAAATGGLLGARNAQEFHSATDFATFWERPERCAPRTTAANRATTVECEFPVPEALATGSRVTLSFPSGFSIGSAAPVAATQSSFNADLNGFGPGTTTFDTSFDSDGVQVNAQARTVTIQLRHTGDAMGLRDALHFELTGITTPETPASEQRISIIARDANGVRVGETINAQPFDIEAAGSLNLVGRVCRGASTRGTCNADDTSVSGIRVTCGQDSGVGNSGNIGRVEATTNASGNWSIAGLTAGEYSCHIPPQGALFSANVGGSSPYQELSLSAGSGNRDCGEANRSDCVDFRFLDVSGAVGASLGVSVTGGAALGDADTTADVDVSCNAGAADADSAATIIAALDFDASGNAAGTLRLENGTTYECSVYPHVPFESFGAGGPPLVPVFRFMLPPTQSVTAGTDTAITFTLEAADRSISGTVRDGGGDVIANVYVHASPIGGCFDAATEASVDCRGGFTQSRSDGTFTVSVADGAYEVSADARGMPPAAPVSVLVDGANVTGVALTMLQLTTTIAGEVRDESGNGIAYAHVIGEHIGDGDTCGAITTRRGGSTDSPTDVNGSYALYVGDGTWCVRAYSRTYGEVGRRTVVVSGTSQSGQHVQATASNFGTVSGTVTRDGQPLAGAFVNCSGSAGSNDAQTGSDGTYSLRIDAGTNYRCQGFAHGSGSLPERTGISVTAGATTTMDFTVGNPGTIRVTIAGVADAFCDARDSASDGSGTDQNTSGVYAIRVSAGTYTVRCGSPRYGQLLNQQNVVAVAGETTALTANSPTLRTVTGRVTDGTANLAGVTVTFTDSEGRAFSVLTGSQGGTLDNVTATGVPEGSYAVSFSRIGYEPTSVDATVAGGNLAISGPIAITPASGANGASVTATVRLNGSPYTGGATVTATKTVSTLTTLTSIVAETNRTNGQATLSLTNGAWTVKATGDNGFESAEATVTVESGVLVGTAPTFTLATAITGYTAANASRTVPLSFGGLLTYRELAVGGRNPEVNVPASTLSSSDATSGSVEMRTNPTLRGVLSGRDQHFVGTTGYDITPRDANGNPIRTMTGTVTIRIPYTDAQVEAAGTEEGRMQLCAYSNTRQTWECFPTMVDTATNTLTAQVNHFSSFGIIGATAVSGSPLGGDQVPPQAVTNPQATATARAVTITWGDPTDRDLDVIDVLRNVPPSTAISGVPVARVPKGVRRYVDRSVEPNETYAYVLRAKDTTGNSRNSALITVTIPAAVTEPPAAGTVVAPPPVATGTVVVTTPTVAPPVTPGVAAIDLSPGTRVKSSATTIYLVGEDGKRYAFPDNQTYRSWYRDHRGVRNISGAQLEALPFGGVMTIRPGTWLVKRPSDPKVYAVDAGGVLRWVETEERAVRLFGTAWARLVVDVPDAFWDTYRIEKPLGGDFHPNGTLLRVGNRTYVIDGLRKRLISPSVFSSLEFQDRFVRPFPPWARYADGTALTSETARGFPGR